MLDYPVLRPSRSRPVSLSGAAVMLNYAGDLPQNDQAQHQPGVSLGSTAVSTQSSGKG